MRDDVEWVAVGCRIVFLKGYCPDLADKISAGMMVSSHQSQTLFFHQIGTGKEQKPLMLVPGISIMIILLWV